ncbi:MAG: winged helix-turn-helix transcriptional regulator [Euryarchaeota archaeon]|nr:winged helix-turn-helix transcriptional regulator [Euryarchaeota archaeon]
MEDTITFTDDMALKASKILSHPLSKEILDVLTEKSAHINEIASATKNHPTTVNRHIRQLEQLGIIQGELTQEDCPTICKRYSLKYDCFKVEFRFCAGGKKEPPILDIGACC